MAAASTASRTAQRDGVWQLAASRANGLSSLGAATTCFDCSTGGQYVSITGWAHHVVRIKLALLQYHAFYTAKPYQIKRSVNAALTQLSPQYTAQMVTHNCSPNTQRQAVALAVLSLALTAELSVACSPSTQRASNVPCDQNLHICPVTLCPCCYKLHYY